MSARRLGLPLACLALCGGLLACDRDDGSTTDAAAHPSASATPPPPVDRLAPGEVAPGKNQIFGFVVPKEMRVVSHSPKRALLEGEVDAGGLIDYVRQRVEVARVEIGAGRTIFPRARIKDGPPDRIYQLEVIPNRRNTRLTVEDVTPAPPTVQENLTQEERWRRAGRRPDGSVDPRELK